MMLGGKLAAAALLALALAGCAGTPDLATTPLPREPGRNLTQGEGQKPLQCAPYARAHSAVKIFGDASTWWDKAADHYGRGSQPATGAVMVLYHYAGSDHGHLAVVRRLVSAREIRVDHANWLDDGSIYLDDPVVDVSAANDWSAVKVWNIQNGSWGIRVYPVEGFISAGAPGDRVASLAPPGGEDAAIP